LYPQFKLAATVIRYWSHRSSKLFVAVM